jgi:predicted lipoprotein with Yx(FWY)xxD motif
MSGMFREIGAIMIKRSDLVAEQAYFERKSGQYFWTPDGKGCYWYESRHELEVAHGDGNVWQVEELED